MGDTAVGGLMPLNIRFFICQKGLDENWALLLAWSPITLLPYNTGGTDFIYPKSCFPRGRLLEVRILKKMNQTQESP